MHKVLLCKMCVFLSTLLGHSEVLFGDRETEKSDSVSLCSVLGLRPNSFRSQLDQQFRGV